jgi:hypothetical protein
LNLGVLTTMMGVGSIRRLSALRPSVAANIAAAWLRTFAISGALAAVSSSVIAAPPAP